MSYTLKLSIKDFLFLQEALCLLGCKSLSFWASFSSLFSGHPVNGFVCCNLREVSSKGLWSLVCFFVAQGH
jgi:hypothetical protein